MIFVFGDCELDLSRGELRRCGEPCHVEPQVFAMIAYLVEHRDRLVTSSELLDHVWQRRFVTPSTLNSRLKAARRAIGDDGHVQQVIRTVRGRGFRFVAPVSVRNGVALTPVSVAAEATNDAAIDALERARKAFTQASWRTAYEILLALDAERELSPSDLERLAEAAWFLMDSGACVRVRERAYRAYVRSNDPQGAARVALALAEDHFHALARSVGQGWFRRAERHLEGLRDVAEAGWVHRLRSVIALAERRLDVAMAEADRALEIGRRSGDPDLEVLALQDRGRILVALGRVTEGMALVDEAMATVMGGQLTAHTTGRTYCNMIVICDQLGDVGRAAEWLQVAERWGAPHADSAFPGICSVYRAGLLRLRGALPEAEREARRATEGLANFLADIAGEAFYELGAIRLRVGDLHGCGAMLNEAHTRGRDPQPGLALLRLAEGNRDAARSMIEYALADPTLPALDRAKLLPAFVEIMVTCGALDPAARGVEELESITSTYTAPALVASAAVARGELELARGRPDDAALHLRRARRTWLDIDMPFELSRTRLLLARAYRTLGQMDEANLEEGAGRAALDRIGAKAFANTD
jgi:DNA-binding winged helix-turn-helix (wHTH) protein